ncbi:restriction endonuclease subunit S [Enterobacter roggenkampii]|uniref:restriction endonuclease subunit S n=1 Tax=Enterobacteriaceae TaxID=543 RepID=UPI00321B382E|nr:restriction endonuclease subunit S [Kluyvera ascorbata]
MSKLSYLEKLLDGVVVEWKTLGDIAEINTGQKPSEILNCSTEFDYINAGTTRSGYTRASNCDGDTVTTPSRGQGGIGFVGYQKMPFWLGPLCYKIRSLDNEVLINKFLFYFLQSKSELLLGLKKEGGVPAVNKSDLAKLEIPLPPVNKQKRIITILDKFTAITDELSNELAARKKQYNYYRDQLLNFEENEVDWKTLLEACDYVDYRGKTPTKTQHGIFLVTAKNIRMGYIDYRSSQEFISELDYAAVMRRGHPKKGDVLITTEAPCGFVAQVDRENIALAQRVIKYRSKDTRLSNSFLKHYLLSSQFQGELMRAATGSTVKGIKGSTLHQLKIPIPNEVEQHRIVGILDNFDTLINSISEGLPREIELRQKQYEYYRDLLFSFTKSNAKGVSWNE